MTLLTGGFLAKGHSVTVVTLYNEDSDFYALPACAKRVALGIDKVSATVIHGLANNLRRVRILRRAIKASQPDVVISHIHRTNVMTILAAGKSVPVIVVEHNDPAMNKAGTIWEMLRHRTYPRARHVVSVSRGLDQHFSWLPKGQHSVIHNPLELPAEGVALDTSEGQPLAPAHWLMAMGRLTEQKGFDLLLEAFARIKGRHPDWNLMIIGEGKLRSQLEQFSFQLDLAQRVKYAGQLANPFPTLRKASLFVMASRFEGFPYVALEAMACGLPVVYTDCPSGPAEIIRDGIDGRLVPNGDVSALAEAMDELMGNPGERERLAARAPDVLTRFGTQTIVSEWESLFARVIEV